MRPKCEQETCTEDAIFKVYLENEIAPKILCGAHAAEKIALVATRMERIK